MAKQTFTTGQVLTAAQMTSLQQTAMGGGSATAKTASYVLVAADAGATVIMNSASATTITVNTSLFSAGDTIFIQNIGAGVSTITAGTATVNTASSLALAQYESGNLYFTAAGASIFSKADGAAAASSFVGCGVKKTTDQSINNSTYTVVSWDSENFDTDTMHDNSTNNTRITVPSGKGGYYLLTGSIAFNSNGTGNRIVRFYKNGSDLRWVASLAAANTGNFTIVPFSQVFNLAAADYIELYAFQSSGGALSVMSDPEAGSHWQMQFLGA